VEDGDSEVDESVVTGESLPVHKQAGSPVIGATINKNGTLRVRATRVGSDTALAQIVKLVQEAQNSKAPGQQLADRAAFWLVLVALIGGGATLVAWLLAGRPFSDAILFAITVVVVTCPDALGLATPTAVMVGTGLGAKRGILFKHAMALEISARIDTVVMDKTGTLTKGEPEVTDLVTAYGIDQAELLRLVAAVECASEHPLAEAIVRRAERAGVDQQVAADGFENVPGHGAVATVDGHRVAVGYNAIALPIAAGVFEPAFGLVLRPEIAALSMSGSSLIVAVNALALKRLRLPQTPPPAEPPQPAAQRRSPAAEATP
jgi:Cu2+-exporting ATPase